MRNSGFSALEYEYTKDYEEIRWGFICKCSASLSLSEWLTMSKGGRASGPRRRDPWARAEVWRNHPEISKAANIRRMFPGFGLGVGAFLVLVAVEELYWKPNHPSDDHHH